MHHCRHAHDFRALLVHAGMRPSARRLSILEALHAKGPLSADDVATQVGVTAHRVTVYRTLHQLHTAGVVTVTDTAGATRYELAMHHSHTITCRSCGRTEVLKDCFFEGTEKIAAKHSTMFQMIDAHALSFFGHCTRCRV